MIAKRNIPKAIKAPMIAPITATIPLTIEPAKSMMPGGAPRNPNSPDPQRKMTPTKSPMIIRIAPTALLFPDPKYAVKIPAIMLAIAKTKVSMLKKYCMSPSIFFSPP